MHSQLMLNEGDVLDFCIRGEKDFEFAWVNFLTGAGIEVAENLLNSETFCLCEKIGPSLDVLMPVQFP